MSAPFVYMKIHHNRLKPVPLNAHPYLIQPLPGIGLACLTYLAGMNCPFAGSDISIDTPPVKVASTAIGLFSISIGVYILQNGILSFNTTYNGVSSSQQKVQPLKTGKESSISKTTPFKPLRTAGPFTVIRFLTISTNPPVRGGTSVQKASTPSRSVEQPILVQPSLCAQQAVISGREPSSSTREEINSSQKAIPSVLPVKLELNLTPKVLPQGEGEQKMTKDLDPTTSAANVVTNSESHPFRCQGKESKQQRRTAKPRKKLDRRRRNQLQTAKTEVDANESSATDLKPADQSPEESAPETLNGCTQNHGHNPQRDVPSVGSEARSAPRKSRNRRRKNAARRRKEGKDGASTPHTSSPLPPCDAEDSVKVAKKEQEKVSSRCQAHEDHGESREAAVKPNKGSKKQKKRRAKQATEKEMNQIGEQTQPRAQASAKGDEVQQGLPGTQEKAVTPLSFPAGKTVKPDEVLDGPAPQTAGLNAADRHREVKKSPRFLSQDVRNDVVPRLIVKKQWKSRRSQKKC